MKMRALVLIMLLVFVPLRAGAQTSYSGLLAAFVDGDGLVDYAGLKADRARLDAVAQSIAAQDPAIYASWDDNEKLAFWLNAYNALTLKLIVDHYPIAPAQGRQAHPANSIQQIPDAWTGVRFSVMGKERTLDEIEHKVIRAEFREPRVHFALVCAALSCPPLRREAYRGDDLEAQLNDQARRFFGDFRNLHIDREQNGVWVSSIIQWFAGDFVPGAIDKLGRAKGERMAVVAATSPHIDDRVREYLENPNRKIHFSEYDWTLNEQVK